MAKTGQRSFWMSPMVKQFINLQTLQVISLCMSYISIKGKGLNDVSVHSLCRALTIERAQDVQTSVFNIFGFKLDIGSQVGPW